MLLPTVYVYPLDTLLTHIMSRKEFVYQKPTTYPKNYCVALQTLL